MKLFIAGLLLVCSLSTPKESFANRPVKTKGRIARALYTSTRVLKSARYVLFGDKSMKELGLNPLNIRRQKLEIAASRLVEEHRGKSFHLIDFLIKTSPAELTLGGSDFIVAVTTLDDMVLETGADSPVLRKLDIRGFDIGDYVPKFTLYQVLNHRPESEPETNLTFSSLTAYDHNTDKSLTTRLRVFQ